MPQETGTGPRRRDAKKQATRRQLIAATLDSLASSGFAETTLAGVAKRAGVSRGLVNFHFESKDRLLVEALRHLIVDYRDFWQKAVDRPGQTPAERLCALIEADFHPQVCNRRKIAVWYAFWGEARSRPTYREVCADADRAYAETLKRLCRAVAEEGGYAGVEPGLVADGLRTMIDGLWLEVLLGSGRIDRVAAKRTCLQHLASAFPRHFTVPEQVRDSA